jgi:hypothetical protein
MSTGKTVAGSFGGFLSIARNASYIAKTQLFSETPRNCFRVFLRADEEVSLSCKWF